MFTDRLFTGQRQIAGLGIYQFGARFYSPELSRFLSADPMGQNLAVPQAFNRYSYALNNPVRYTDPTGYWFDEGCGTGGAGGGTGCTLPSPISDPGDPGSGGGGGGGEDGGGDGSGGSASAPLQPLSSTLDMINTIGTGSNGCQTVTCKALSGDIYALMDLLFPTHGGIRIQGEGTVFIFSGTVGVNLVYNSTDGQLATSGDWSLGGGPGIGAGVAVTVGPLIGWGSSNVEDATSGNSLVLSGSAAAELAGTVALSAPIDSTGLHVDPYYGQVPVTLYLGGGAGGDFADAGLSLAGTFAREDLSHILP